MRNVRIGILLALLLGLFSACDDGKQTFDENITVNPVEIIGTVGGVIFDASTDAPLAGVEVTVISGGNVFTVTTDETGIYSIADVPATGNIVVLYDAENYYSARQVVSFSESESDTPYASPTATVPPTWLVNSTGVLRLRVIDDDGRPVEGIPVQVNADPVFVTIDQWGNFYGQGQTTDSQNTNTLGIVQFDELPATNQIYSDNAVTVNISEYDSDGDGYPDFNGTTVSYNLRTNSETIKVIKLSRVYSGSLSISDSTMPYFTGSTIFPGTYGPGDTVYINFSREVSEDTIEVELMEKTQGGASWLIEPTVQGSLIYFDLPEDIEFNEKYYLRVYATTPDSMYFVERSVAVFTPVDGDLSVSLVEENSIDPASPIIVTFNHHIGNGIPGLNTYTGSDGIVYFDVDLDTSGQTGDSSNENDYYNSTVVLETQEDYPFWLPGYYPAASTNFSTTFKFSVPGTITINPGVTVWFRFDITSSANYKVRTPDGYTVLAISAIMP
ncbi:MAG: carboxypeptidase regulatory-like domain-containing protein [Deltaproteobacteria bacterium]|nr:carboxypeptidase regulatory-like domain-containing protein [Deltaproteobacteria bacterium]